MSKQNARQGRKALVIVESPAKARTISKFLGGDFVIEASIGHIRDLPENKKQLPEKFQKEDWAYLGVNVQQDFEPVYVVSPDKREQVRKLKKLVEDARELYLATDEDREGEAISWHLREVLNPKVPVRRMVFHEITRSAIQHALQQPRDIDQDLVRAQETRRILDRLYGYDVSQLLWRKMGRLARSAGRVQSVAVRLIVERERERMAFVAAEYWDLLGTFAKQAGAPFQADLVRLNDRRLATGKDFDPATGKLRSDVNGGVLILSAQQAEELRQRLLNASFRVASLEEKPEVSRPYAPFTTSTLQQEGNRKLRFTARRTMQLAQNLYQNGYITYMRTDSTALSDEAIGAARQLILQQFGPEYLPAQPRVYTGKVKNAQEAHEAIRPAGNVFRSPEELRNELQPDEWRLYELIWKRTVASQMENARLRRMTLVAAGTSSAGERAEFQATGKAIDFPGYLRAYVEGADDPQAELENQERLLPAVQVGEGLDCQSLETKEHSTSPPARYTEATLTKTLETMGIGRPSTYATIIDTILERNYVFKRGNALVPTWTAMAVVNLMEQHLPDLVDYQFTARLEDDLDSISRGEAGHVDYLRTFYYGKDREGLKHQVEDKLASIDIREICQFRIDRPGELEQGAEPIYVRVGRYGPFLEQGERRASIPDDAAPDEVTVAKAQEWLQRSAQGEAPLGICPETNRPVFLKSGRFGPYVQRGTADDPDPPQNASLLKGMAPQDVTLEVALRLLSLPRELGKHPDTGETVIAANGRFGPYVKCGNETRSLPDETSPLDLTLAQALELLRQPKASRRRFAAPREPLKTFSVSPVTHQPVRLLDGRYGPYVTDGQTNASLPKGTSPEELSFEQALELLAARAAQGPPKRGGRGFRTRRAAAGSSQSNGGAKKPRATRKKSTGKRAAE